MKKSINFLYKFILIVLIIYFFIEENKNSELVKSNASKNSFELIKVIDGDTIRIKYQNKIRKVRLIGIDAFEAIQNDRMKRESKKFEISNKVHLELGQLSKNYLKNKLRNNKFIELAFDKEKEDQYGRLLAYIYTENKMINQEMIALGLVKTYHVKPNTSYRHEFNQSMLNACKNKLGIWKTLKTKFCR